MTQAYPESENTQLSSLRAILDKAATREKLFDNLDSTIVYDIYNPGKNTPIFKEACRWVKHGSKIFIDYQGRDYVKADEEGFQHIKISSDGQTARSLFVHQMRAKIFRDWKKDVVRGHYYGPDIMGITTPTIGGRTISSFLQDEPLLSPSLLKRITRKVKVLGKEDIDGEPCVVVEVALSDSPARKEVWRFYMAERYDYCVLQCEHSFVRDGVPSLGSRMKMSKFQCIKENLWYPTEAKYDVFRGEENPRQSTLFKIDRISWLDEFDEKLFFIDFPPGTHVFDTIKGLDYKN